MRWVKEILPPRPRARWLLITIRLSRRSLAGTARTDVAVGTARLASMLATVREAAPRSRISLAARAAGAGGCAGPSPAPGPGCGAVACAGPVIVASPFRPGAGRGLASVCGPGAAGAVA